MMTGAHIRTRDETRRVMISGFAYQFSRWERGQRLPGRLMGLDTETSIIVENQIPSLAVAIASDGRHHILIHPDDLGAFLLLHPLVEYVCHNAAFDFWVIHQHLANRGETAALQAWKQVVVEKRLHDTMLLDILLRLGRGEEENHGDDHRLQSRNLAEVVREYTGLEISKEDPYRLRFGEIIDRNWSQVEPAFFEYAIKDAICTLLAYREMSAQAEEVMVVHGHDPAKTEHFDIYPDAVSRFGLLSEAIQVEGAVALAQITRNGMHTDAPRLQASVLEYQRVLSPLIHEFQTNYPGIMLFDAHGQPKLTPSGLPSKSQKQLDQQLVKAVEDIGRQTGNSVTLPRTPKGKVSHSLGMWSGLIDQHPFLKLWEHYETKAKLNQFFKSFDRPVIHPKYSVIVRTGRTSCSSPNMQQVPREDAFRQIIIPSPNHLLLAVDYSYVELITLAAVCQSRFGFSRLGDVIKSRVDPHCYTAAILVGIPLEEFMNWKQSNKDQFKLSRQQAKPVNFGVPGGMGPAALVDYACNSYGVTMTLEQAESFHQQLTQSIYPELGLYLEDTSLAYLAVQLNVPESICRDAFCFGDMSPANAAVTVRNIVRGRPFKKDGTPYQADFVQRTWGSLISLNRNPELTGDLMHRVGSQGLVNKLFDNAAITLTGRIRGNTSYTQQRNTPFQSLASDGAKRAMGRLVLAGYRIVGFIHDEILVELPDQGGYVDRAIVEDVVRIMKGAMQELTGDVPVGCEYALSVCWSKSAEAIVEGDKVWAWKPKE